MRTLLKFEIPVEAGNAVIKDGSIEKVLGSTLERLRPEAAYFYAEHGRRAGIIVFDLKEPSDIPSVVEPMFSGFNASIEIYPAMNADELKAGIPQSPR